MESMPSDKVLGRVRARVGRLRMSPHRPRYRSTRRTALAGMIVLGACATPSPPPAPPVPPTRQETAAPTNATLPLAAFGQVQLLSTEIRTDADFIRLRGMMKNPYDEPVEGVRMICRILNDPSPTAVELDRFQRVLDVTLASGAQTSFNLDLQSNHAGTRFGSVRVQAFAIKRGDRTMPLPPEWRQQ